MVVALAQKVRDLDVRISTSNAYLSKVRWRWARCGPRPAFRHRRA
jgi:hypothetical protein